jgi:hypothetical protein
VSKLQPRCTSKTVGDWLDDFYGSLFLPQATFTRLRSQPAPLSAALVIIIVNVLEALRTGQSIWLTPFSAASGLVGWLLLILILHRLITICQNQEPVSIATLLTLTGFASSPWIFIVPVQSLDNAWTFFLAVVVFIWFGIWQIWAAAIALGMNPRQLILLVPMGIAGGMVSIVLLANVSKLLLSFS